MRGARQEGLGAESSLSVEGHYGRRNEEGVCIWWGIITIALVQRLLFVSEPLLCSAAGGRKGTQDASVHDHTVILLGFIS